MIYLDHCATTPISATVKDAMEPYLQKQFGNASTLYQLGREAKTILEESRVVIASALGAEPEEIFFISGGTEGDNWVIKSACNHNKIHLITTAIEHSAILSSCKFMEEHGAEVTYLDVDHYGRVDPQDVLYAITPQTALVSVMAINNETGTIQPITEIAEICARFKVPFHTDAVQAIGNIPIHVKKQKISYLTLSGHKLYGPKGIGVLYMDKRHLLPPLIHGGGQESKLRSGTENIPAIVGMSTAVSEITQKINKRIEHFKKLREALLFGLNDVSFKENGCPFACAPHIMSLTFPGVEAEALLHLLDLKGVCVSTGSACHGGEEQPSHVLLAMGILEASAKSTIRISFGDANSMADIEKTIKVLKYGLAKIHRQQ